MSNKKKKKKNQPTIPMQGVPVKKAPEKKTKTKTTKTTSKDSKEKKDDAKEEKELFKLLYMCDRSGDGVPVEASSFSQMTDMLCRTIGMDEETARLFHLEMWAYVHGIATMFATGFLDLDWDLVSRMLTDVYQGLRKQYGMGE